MAQVRAGCYGAGPGIIPARAARPAVEVPLTPPLAPATISRSGERYLVPPVKIIIVILRQLMVVLEHIIGADRLVDRFGRWPSFHDAVVIRLTLDSRGVSGATAEMLVHTWAMTDTVDEKGYYVLEKHTLVRFIFEHLTSCELSDFSNPEYSSAWASTATQLTAMR